MLSEFPAQRTLGSCAALRLAADQITHTINANGKGATMMRYPTATRIGVAIAVSSIFIAAALAQDAKPGEVHVVKGPSDVKWSDGPPSLPKGVKVAVLNGDPGKAAPFTLLLKMPAGYKVAPHWHSQDENVLVLSGTLYA